MMYCRYICENHHVWILYEGIWGDKTSFSKCNALVVDGCLLRLYIVQVSIFGHTGYLQSKDTDAILCNSWARVICRPMTNAEKQQLGRRIQKLPGEALGGVVDIFRQRNSSATDFPDDVFVNLEELVRLAQFSGFDKLKFFSHTMNVSLLLSRIM